MLKMAEVATAAKPPVPRKPCVREQILTVQIAVAELTGVGLTQLCDGLRGAPEAAFARQMAMYLCHVVFAASFSEIGRAFGRDRATARHAIHRVEEAREDREIDRALYWLEALLRRSGKRP